MTHIIRFCLGLQCVAVCCSVLRCVAVCCSMLWILPRDVYTNLQPISFGVTFLRSQMLIDDVVLCVSFATSRWKETKEIEIGD